MIKIKLFDYIYSKNALSFFKFCNPTLHKNKAKKF
ncbi:hypothetical protein L935_07645 [Helicobacter pylori PZ5086]|nr:hypothetical protein L935_07645 [Helicobacter pylori PZ5086]EQD98142.1 hypothetical protein L930_08065 [Helicobacter pylori PZ5004]